MKSRVDLTKFDENNDFDRGCSRLKEVLWYLVKVSFFLSALPWPNSLKTKLLRLFGAKIGSNVNIKPRVNIHFPWRLEVGDGCWLGEECWLLNFESIKLGSSVCISQRAFLCCGNHDFRQSHMPFRNAPIEIEDGAWVGAGVFVSPGVVVGVDSVITAGSVVTKSLPGNQVCSGNPCEPRKQRWRD